MLQRETSLHSRAPPGQGERYACREIRLPWARDALVAHGRDIGERYLSPQHSSGNKHFSLQIPRAKSRFLPDFFLQISPLENLERHLKGLRKFLLGCGLDFFAQTLERSNLEGREMSVYVKITTQLSKLSSYKSNDFLFKDSTFYVKVLETL